MVDEVATPGFDNEGGGEGGSIYATPVLATASKLDQGEKTLMMKHTLFLFISILNFGNIHTY